MLYFPVLFLLDFFFHRKPVLEVRYALPAKICSTDMYYVSIRNQSTIIKILSTKDDILASVFASDTAKPLSRS